MAKQPKTPCCNDSFIAVRAKNLPFRFTHTECKTCKKPFKLNLTELKTHG